MTSENLCTTQRNIPTQPVHTRAPSVLLIGHTPTRHVEKVCLCMHAKCWVSIGGQHTTSRHAVGVVDDDQSRILCRKRTQTQSLICCHVARTLSLLWLVQSLIQHCVAAWATNVDCSPMNMQVAHTKSSLTHHSPPLLANVTNRTTKGVSSVFASTVTMRRMSTLAAGVAALAISIGSVSGCLYGRRMHGKSALASCVPVMLNPQQTSRVVLQSSTRWQ